MQSGSEQVLREYNRPVDRELSIKAAQTIVDCGIVGFFDLMTRSEFETEETCRETFEFLLDFPQQMKTVGFYPMTLFPGYGYTEHVRERQASVTLSDRDYAYYHKLYLLTRTELPHRVKRAVGSLKVFRRFPKLIDPLLPKTLPFFYLDNGALDLDGGNLALTDEEGQETHVRLRDVEPTSLGTTGPRGGQAMGGSIGPM